MNYSLNTFSKKLLLVGLLLVNNLGVNISQAAVSGTVALTQIPLATSSTSLVKPNLLLVLDDSGSMSWDHMPDDGSDAGSAVTWAYGYYGLRSSQCNQVYYDPTYSYTPPVKADGTLYSNSSFTSAWADGYSTGSGTVNLDNAYRASQSLAGDGSGQSGYYYLYSGSQLTTAQKNYNSTTNTFYSECNSAQNSATGTAVFSKRRLASTETTTIVLSGGGSGSGTQVSSITVGGTTITSGATAATNNTITLAGFIAAKITSGGYSATSVGSTVTITGPTSAKNLIPVINSTNTGGTAITFSTDVFPDTTAANLTNFANWYSYYRTRILMMKTATGRAFGNLTGSDYRVGLMKISQTGTPTVPVGLFTGTQRSTWFTSLYGISPTGSTPLRRALSEAGRYYAGLLGGTDPLQYSCQQNFSILTTDGYWNTGDGYQMDGSTAVGNTDRSEPRPRYDGAQAATTTTTYYTQNAYTKLKASTSGCPTGQTRLSTQLQRFSCAVTLGVETCGPTSNVGTATLGTCAATASVIVPSPNPSSRILDSSKTPNPAVPVPGYVGGSFDSLSDVAMYYYNTDLRPGNCTLCTDNVFLSGTDNNPAQHMTTFTLGLGASGKMIYSPNYATDSTGDFAAVKHGDTASATVCTWQASGTVCNWPMPGMDSSGNGFIENIDDLWHAAIDGHGAYFSATNPDTLSTGLDNALASIQSRKGAGAAAATSTLNPVANNNLAYVASYTTVAWQGNLEARGIDVDTGVVNENAEWCVDDVPAGNCSLGSTSGTVITDTTQANGAAVCQISGVVSCPVGGVLSGNVCSFPIAKQCTGKLPVQVAANSRKIWTKGAHATSLNNFTLTGTNADLSSTNFDSTKLANLTQWSAPAPDGLDATQKTLAPTKIIDYLRGSHDYEYSSITPANQLFRTRTGSLGDAVESQPAYIGAPTFSYLDTGYSAFKSAQASRLGTVYMGANDGMLHAFDASTDSNGVPTSTGGNERWAYVPSMVIPNLWKLADSAYKDNHQYFVNGSPVIGDVYDAGTSTWKTILVAGLGAGGRGYYALDITDPTTPKLLWEFTNADLTTGNQNLGYSYGAPIITKKANGDWVVLVTSGYNNLSPGDGQGYLYVINALGGPGSSTKPMVTIGTGVGSTTTPSGLAQIAAWADEPEKNNTATFVYGGDLLGNVWRFDISAGTKIKFAQLCSNTTGACNGQPITARVELGKVIASGTGHRVIFVATGKYLESTDVSDTQQQSIYAIKDDDATATVATNPRTLTSTTPNGMIQQTISGNPLTVTSNAVNFATDLGWFVDFPVLGERTNVAPRLESGTLLVPSLRPSSTVCKAGGDGRLYAFNYKTGSKIGSTLSFDTGAPIVGINIVYINGVPKVSVVTSEDPTPQLLPDVPFGGSSTGFQSKRVIWRELIQ